MFLKVEVMKRFEGLQQAVNPLLKLRPKDPYPRAKQETVKRLTLTATLWEKMRRERGNGDWYLVFSFFFFLLSGFLKIELRFG